MYKINWLRVILGGLLAGVVINVFEALVNGVLFAERIEAELGTRTMPSYAIPLFILWGFIVGIVAVWIYASIRRTYGAGPRTAIIAGVATWVIGYALANLSFFAIGVFSGGMMAVATAIGLVEVILATLAGAWLYRPAEEIVAIEPGVSA